MDLDDKELVSLGYGKISIGKDLNGKLNLFKNIHGVAKIQKKIVSEVSSIQKAMAQDRLTINHILCSNLVHFAYLVKILNETENIHSVDFPIKLRGEHKTFIRVDIIADEGSTWIKVIARNSKALNDIAFGRSNYGTKSILDHAKCYTEAANDNLHYFRSPKVVFDFANQIDEELESSLIKMQVVVRINGKLRDDCAKIQVNNLVSITKLNLDVTTMMAFVSNLTCESCDLIFSQPILNDQACREREVPTKLFLDELFKGKELIACETARESFQNILDIVGGPNEKIRGRKFLSSVKILPDLKEMEENSMWSENRLRLGKKIQKRTYKIFTFGLFHSAMTVTANKGAVEAAKMQGISIPVVIHDARALTEQKQTSPVVIYDARALTEQKQTSAEQIYYSF